MNGARNQPVEALAGADCRWCDAATLAEAEYKGDRALVCPDCGTPALRLF